MSSGVEAVQTMVDHMKTTLEEAQANLSVVHNTELKNYANKLRGDEKYEVGDEVVLTTRHLPVSQAFTRQITAALGRTLQNCQGDFF